MGSTAVSGTPWRRVDVKRRLLLLDTSYIGIRARAEGVVEIHMRSLCMLISLHVLLVSMLLASSALAVNVGDDAPDFTLPSTMDTTISLSQFKGKKHVLIEFYSLDFNPV
jgi:hypothetical protein